MVSAAAALTDSVGLQSQSSLVIGLESQLELRLESQLQVVESYRVGVAAGVAVAGVVVDVSVGVGMVGVTVVVEQGVPQHGSSLLTGGHALLQHLWGCIGVGMHCCSPCIGQCCKSRACDMPATMPCHAIRHTMHAP